jgi:hypothetical protein
MIVRFIPDAKETIRISSLALMLRWAGAVVALTAVLTTAYVVVAARVSSFPGLGLFLFLEMPGAILRPDAWLFHHDAFTPIVTSALASLVWLAPFAFIHLVQHRLAGRDKPIKDRY